MQRQPFGNARYRDNAQLPETFPIVKDASKEFGAVRKRKAIAANQDLRVQVLQEQAKRPAQVARASTDFENAPPESRPVQNSVLQSGQPPRSPFQGLPMGAISFNGLAELVASERSAPAPERSCSLNRLVSFDDLSAQIDSSSRQSGLTRFGAPPRFDQDAPEQAGGLTTFGDIATRQELQEEQHEGLDHTITAVTRFKSVANSEDFKSRDGISRKPSKAQQPTSLPKQTLTDLSHPCIDLSLKTRALFFSQQPFDICREAFSLPASHATSAASGFAGNQDSSSASLPQRLQRALMTWQHPSAAMPAAAVAAVAASKQGAAFVEERRELWRESFRNIYMAVQSGCCHCFYFLTPQDARKPFVAYFGAAGTLGRPSMHAWLSRSTHGLRERLRAEPHGLVFTAPLALGADVSARDERMQAELKEASQMSWAPSTSGRSDDKAASLLYFDDRPQAHGLFEFLMHETLGSSEAVDVPMLLGPVPFVGATFHQHVPHMLPHMGSRRDGERKRGAHKLELRGVLPPWVLDRLCHVLEEAQQSQLQVVLETHSATTAFNLSQAEEATTEENKHSDQRSTAHNREHQRWRSVRPCMAGFVTRELSCQDGLYSAEMEPVQLQ
ncbi:g4783 [Coccomyxa viridis]|uniref:G4783 protein n=1 Tax=Coccomyxa viridis TaxID=1274662 RepID=A0ABP1FR69_9CHLO